MKYLFLHIFIIASLLVPQKFPADGTATFVPKVFVNTDDFGAEYLDDLEKQLNNSSNDTLRLMLYNDLGYYYHTRNLNKSIKILEQGLEEARKKGNRLWEGYLQVSQGAVLLRMEKLDLAEKVLLSAKEKIPDEHQWLLYTNLGYVYERRGDLSKAFEIASLSLDRAEKFQDLKAKAMALSDLSNLFWKLGKFEEGLEYGLKSLALFKQRGIKDLDYDFTHHVVGNNLIALGRYEEALINFKSSVQIGEQYDFYNNLSDTYMALAELYMKLNQYENSESSAQEALKYAQLLENNFMVMRSFLILGKIKNSLGEFENAVEYLQKSIRVATADFGDLFFLGLAYQELSTAHEGLGELEESLRTHKMYHQLQKEVFNAEADQRLATLQTQMEVNQKENIISLQQARFEQQNTIQVFILVLAGILIFFLVILYRYFLKKKKYSELLEKQNREKEFLLKEIHHRVKNNLEIISSLLSLQAAEVEDHSVQNIMVASQNRVHSMGMIHQNLYVGENIASIEMKNYFLNLGNYIIDTYGATERIKINCPMESLELDIDRAIPIGLIVNELLTNSLKYAYPDDHQGEILISLIQKNNRLLLQVADNGIGIHPNIQTQGTGFGNQLVSLLCRQLDGKMNIISDNGTQIFFEFQTNPAA